MVSIEWNDSIKPKIIGDNQVNSSTYKNYVQMIDESELSRLYPGYDAAKSDCEMQLYPIANYFVALNVSGFMLADGSPLNDELTYDIVLDTDHPSTYGAIVWYNPDTNSFVQTLAPNPQLGFTELSYSQKFERYIAPPAPDNNLHYLDNLGLQRFKANIDENLNEIKRTPVTTSGTGAAYVAQVKGINAANIYMVPVGTSFTMIPHTDSTTVKPTLNVNGLGAREIRVKSMVNNDAAIPTEDKFLLRDKPVDVMFDGTYWVCDMTVVDSAAMGISEVAKKANEANVRSIKLSNNLPVLVRSGHMITPAIVKDIGGGDVSVISCHTSSQVAQLFGMKTIADGGQFDSNDCMLFVENRDLGTYLGTVDVVSNVDDDNEDGAIVIANDVFDTHINPDFVDVSYTYVYVPKKRSFVVFSADDGSFNMYNREVIGLPEVGSVYDGVMVSNVFEFDPCIQYDFKKTPWEFVKPNVLNVYVKDNISPIYTTYWFFNMEKCKNMNLRAIDTSNVVSMCGMFRSCDSLTSLDLSSFNTSNVADMRDMFYYSEQLTSIDVSNFDTSNVTEMRSMFSGCRAVTSLDVSNFDTSNVTNMRDMFHNCNSLTFIDVSNFDTSNVTNMSGMFGYCEQLTSIDISNFDTSNVTEMDRMFDYCISLTSLDVSNFNTANVTKIDGMFQNCRSLTSLDISNFNTRNVTIMKDVFNGCNSLTSLDISNFDTSNVDTMDGMFYNCDSLTSIDVSSFDTSNLTYAEEMFYGCSSLTLLDLSSFDASKLIMADSMFKNCSSLKEIIVSNSFGGVDGDFGVFYNCISLVGGKGTTYDSKNTSGTYARIDNPPTEPGYFTEKQKLTFAVYSDDDKSLTFYNRYNLPMVGDIFNGKIVTKIYDSFENEEHGFYNSPPWVSEKTLINTVNVIDIIKPISTSYWFDEFSSVQSIDISNLDVSNVVDMSNMFYNCQNLTFLKMPNFYNSKITNMNNMFGGCESLKDLDVSHFNTSNVTNMNSMFYGCLSLTSLDLSGFDASKIKTIAFMFMDCTSLKTIFASEKTKLSHLTDSLYFYYCTSLIGGKGTKYDPSHVNPTYARIDNPPSEPGYFTEKV